MTEWYIEDFEAGSDAHNVLSCIPPSRSCHLLPYRIVNISTRVDNNWAVPKSVILITKRELRGFVNGQDITYFRKIGCSGHRNARLEFYADLRRRKSTVFPLTLSWKKLVSSSEVIEGMDPFHLHTSKCPTTIYWLSYGYRSLKYFCESKFTF